jgi:hypothetical protein
MGLLILHRLNESIDLRTSRSTNLTIKHPLDQIAYIVFSNDYTNGEHQIVAGSICRLILPSKNGLSALIRTHIDGK